MAKVLPCLDDSEPVHGDIDTVTFLTDIHKVQRFICLVKLVVMKQFLSC